MDEPGGITRLARPYSTISTLVITAPTARTFPMTSGPVPALSKIAPNFYGNSFPHVCFDALDSYSCWGVTDNGDNVDNGIRLNDSVNWQKGRNSFKFGVDFRYQAIFGD